MFQTKQTDENFYMASIGRMSLRLVELQDLDKKAQKLRATKELWEGWTDIDGVLHHKGLLVVPEVIRTKFISQRHDDPLASYFCINKTRKIIGQKYYWPSLKDDVEAYIKGCDICLSSKVVNNKPYGALTALPIPTYQ